MIAHQKYVVWHPNYGQYLCYFINAREVTPHFIPARKVPPCLGVTGTAEGGTAIFYYYGKITAIFRYCEKITALFRSTGNRRNQYRHISLLRENYRHISQYREPPKKNRQVEILHRMCPPKKTVPRSTTLVISTRIKIHSKGSDT